MKMKQSFKIIFKTLLIYLVLWLDFWYFYILNGEYQNSETSSQSTLNQECLYLWPSYFFCDIFPLP